MKRVFLDYDKTSHLPSAKEIGVTYTYVENTLSNVSNYILFYGTLMRSMVQQDQSFLTIQNHTKLRCNICINALGNDHHIYIVHYNR